MKIDDFVALFPDAKKQSGGFICCCPAHEDHTPSLSISAGEQGVLVKCFAGCPVASILATKGLKEKDLFYDKRSSRNGSHTLSEILAQYLYYEADGTLVYRVTRHLCDGRKTFRQWRVDPTARDGFRMGLGGIDPILYRLPQLIEAAAQHHAIYIAEGEKDVDCLGKHGFPATCNTGGAGKWREAYNQYFAGTNVVIIADKDTPGRAHALGVCKQLYPIAACVKYLELPGPGVKDAHDYFASGATSRQFLDLCAATAAFDPNEQPTIDPASNGTLPYPPLRWAGESLLHPEPLREALIEGVLRRRDMMVLSGPSKSHKSWSMLCMAVCIAAGLRFLGHPTVKSKVLYVNCEIHSSDFDQRLRVVCEALGVDPAEIQDNLAVLHLRGFDSTHSVLLPQIVAYQKDFAFGVVMIDPSYFLYDELLEENSNADITRLLRGITQFSEPANFATVFAAHFAKGNAAARTMIDRTAGASAWARYPDCLLMLTPLDEQSKRFNVEFSLRSHPKIPVQIANWEFPLLKIDAAATEAEAIAALHERAKAKSGTTGRRQLTLEEYMGVIPLVAGLNSENTREYVLSGAEERTAIQKLGYHLSQIRDVRELAVQKGMIATVVSTLAGRNMYVGIPGAIALWKPHLEREDALARADRARAKNVLV